MNMFIIGPCSMESEALYKETGSQLVSIMANRDWYYKASFDKANRTSVHSKRGPGLSMGLQWARELKKTYPHLKLITDVHETQQIELIAGVFDVVQIPAFLCRQTDLLLESAKHFSVVNIKKGQWMSPSQMARSVDKIKTINPKAEVWLTERGSFFGYGSLVVDFAAVSELKASFDKVVLDCTHSTQRHRGDFTGGDRDLAKKYTLAAPIFDFDGVFAEVHPNPANALSDAESQISLSSWTKLLKQFDAIQNTVTKTSENNN